MLQRADGDFRTNTCADCLDGGWHMKKKILAYTVFLLITLSCLPKIATAEVTCSDNPIAWAVLDCETDTLGPVAVNWNWNTSGNLDGNWVSPQGNPQRSWFCGEQGMANTLINVTIEFSDETFDFEYREVDCHFPPVPSDIQTAWTFGYCHQCDCTEWEVSHSATNASSYIVEQSAASSGPWTVYSATPTGMSYPHNGASGRWYRIKASNRSGHIYGSATFKTGSWCDYCGGGGEEP